MIFEDVLGAYLSARPHFRRGPGNNRDQYSLGHLQPHFGGRRIRDLKRYEIRSYINRRLEQGVKLSTVRRELRLFCAAINFAKAEFGLEDMPNPVARLGLSKEEPRVRWLTRQEAATLIKEAEFNAPRPHLPAFIRLALNTGCRRGELLNLEWSRVNFEQKHILLEARHNKSRKRRTVPLNDDALSVLKRMQQWQEEKGVRSPWVFGWERGRITTFKTAWTSALKRSGITDFRIHDLRHTFASWMVMQGISLYVVKELLGHASITQTEIYAHLAPSQAEEAVQRLLPF